MRLRWDSLPHPNFDSKLLIFFDLPAPALLNAKQLTKQKNLKLKFSSSLFDSGTYVEFEVFAKSDGNGCLKFEIGSVKVIEFGAGAFTLGYDVADSELTLLSHHWVDRTYKLVSAPLHPKPESNPERQTTTLQNLNT